VAVASKPWYTWQGGHACHRCCNPHGVHPDTGLEFRALPSRAGTAQLSRRGACCHLGHVVGGQKRPPLSGGGAMRGAAGLQLLLQTGPCGLVEDPGM
jgi:hypothetical protein